MTFSKFSQAPVTTMPSSLYQNIAPQQQSPEAAASLRFQNYRNTLARITPIDNHGRWGESHIVELKDFDERSITFHHRMPLSDRRAVVVLESPQLGRFTAEVDLTWCRFNRTDRYTSGGRLVRRINKTA